MEDDENLKGLFNYQLFMDKPPSSGNFEVYVYTTEDRSDEGFLVFSRKATRTFPSKDWDGFMEKIKEWVDSK